MVEKDCIALLTNCKSLAQHLIEVFDLQNYSLSTVEMNVMKSFFNMRANKSYTQLKFLSSRAKITADQFDYLDEMYIQMLLRFLNGTDMQTGKAINIIMQWLQWLDGKINWKINVGRKIRIYSKYF